MNLGGIIPQLISWNIYNWVVGRNEWITIRKFVYVRMQQYLAQRFIIKYFPKPINIHQELISLQYITGVVKGMKPGPEMKSPERENPTSNSSNHPRTSTQIII